MLISASLIEGALIKLIMKFRDLERLIRDPYLSFVTREFDMPRGNTGLTWLGFGLRFMFALLLVLLTYNPSGYSYSHWLLSALKPLTISPLLAICAILICIGWVVYLRATMASLGALGLALASVLCACIVWLFVDIGWLSLSNVSALSWLSLFALALLLAVGMSWSHIRRRLSGQVDTDDVES